MVLVIDIGNTRVKAAVFELNTILEISIFDAEDLLSKVEIILQLHPKIENIVVASVGDFEKNHFLRFAKMANVCFISHESRFPFRNQYATPQTLGIDRMALASGAVLKFPNANRLIIDAGTCITYDFIDSDNNYLGGAISPGIKLRYESLHLQTAKLPLLTREKPKGFIGNSTNESIHSGVVNGCLLEIDGFIELYKANYIEIKIILTGGDADFLAIRLKNTIFANQNFLLESLNQTFQFNQK